jgi:ribonuclease HI
MWIPSHSGITENEKADKDANNALEEDINDRELYPSQDRVSTGRKHNEIQKGN